LVAVSIFLVYAVGVAAVTVFPIHLRPGSRGRTGGPWWIVIQAIPFDVPPVSFVLNIALFAPLGILVPLLWPKADSVRRMAGLAVCVSGGIELAQFILWVTLGSYRMVDVNDLIANTGGAVLGLLALRAAVPEPDRRRRLLA
jgi:glycopeptide antibiotics resistance protein